mmetsp:Transcript_17239/g.19451  ORF Transcript_17239/g.19451 Transcript_17239/m.19451 type:complete len:355 (+) Transcript_17239:1036-2100(+)
MASSLSINFQVAPVAVAAAAPPATAAAVVVPAFHDGNVFFLGTDTTEGGGGGGLASATGIARVAATTRVRAATGTSSSLRGSVSSVSSDKVFSTVGMSSRGDDKGDTILSYSATDRAKCVSFVSFFFFATGAASLAEEDVSLPSSKTAVLLTDACRTALVPTGSTAPPVAACVCACSNINTLFNDVTCCFMACVSSAFCTVEASAFFSNSAMTGLVAMATKQIVAKVPSLASLTILAILPSSSTSAFSTSSAMSFHWAWTASAAEPPPNKVKSFCREAFCSRRACDNSSFCVEDSVAFFCNSAMTGFDAMATKHILLKCSSSSSSSSVGSSSTTILLFVTAAATVAGTTDLLAC